MKQATLIASALICATLLTAGTVSAQLLRHKSAPAPASQAQTMWATQSPHPPFPVVRTPVAGYSPNFAAPQPATKATLERDANRLIRWQGWLDVDAFSVSILNQMQKQSEGAPNRFFGSYTITEPVILEAVLKAKANNPTFEMNPNLEEGNGEHFIGTPTLYVWTYRHNFADKGLYQLYVSAKGKIDLGTEIVWQPWQDPDTPVRHKDIQSLAYEFGDDSLIAGGSGSTPREVRVIADIEIWRGAVARVDAQGILDVVGNEAGVVTLDGAVEEEPMSRWERAPSLINNPNYDPRRATGAAFVEPLERAITIPGNTLQSRAGDVQRRVNTNTPFRFRSR